MIPVALTADYAKKPEDDGVVILYSSVSGGSTEPNNLGAVSIQSFITRVHLRITVYQKTLTHEAGHWVGLYHTFQGGCSFPGDHVWDTPAEAGPAKGCPIGRDSCPAETSDDPIRT